MRELEEYGVIKGELRGGVRYFDETEREIIGAVAELARYGVGGRNLRVFRSSADREANLLQQILAPALRSRNPQRRKEAVEALENLAAVATHLKHLLLVRDLRKIVALMSDSHARCSSRADAGLERSAGAARADPRDPGLPASRGSASRTSRRCWPTAARCRRPCAGWPSTRGRCSVDCVIAAEARGFLLGPALALELGAGFVLARKPGKLPYETVSAEYLLEYGAGELELHTDALGAGTRVLGARRPARHRRHRAGAVRAGRAARRRGRRLRLSDRARVPGRARAAGARTRRTRCSPTSPDGCGAPMPTARRSRTIAAPAQELWEMIRDPHHLPRWWPRVSRVEDVDARTRSPRCCSTREGQSRARRLRAGRGDERAAAAALGAALEGTPFARAAEERPRPRCALSGSAGGAQAASATEVTIELRQS